MRKTIAIKFLSSFLLLLAPLVVFAQTERGALVGVVTDSTGAVVPGADVTIVNLGNNSKVTAKSKDSTRRHS